MPSLLTHSLRTSRRTLGAVVLASALTLTLALHAQQTTAVMLVRNARVFDGTRVLDRHDVLVRDVMGIVFAGGPAPGAFAFQIDNVRLR